MFHIACRKKFCFTVPAYKNELDRNVTMFDWKRSERLMHSGIESTLSCNIQMAGKGANEELDDAEHQRRPRPKSSPHEANHSEPLARPLQVVHHLPLSAMNVFAGWRV